VRLHARVHRGRHRRGRASRALAHPAHLRVAFARRPVDRPLEGSRRGPPRPRPRRREGCAGAAPRRDRHRRPPGPARRPGRVPGGGQGEALDRGEEPRQRRAAAQAGLHLAERVRHHAERLRGRRGQREVRRGAGPPRPQRDAGRGRGAPIAGVVAKKMVNAGEKVGVDGALVSIVDLARMEIEAPAPASEIPAIRIGRPRRSGWDGFGERAFTGRLERINPTTEPGSRSITLYLSVDNRDGSCGAACSRKAASSSTRARPRPSFRDGRAGGGGQTFVFTVEQGRSAGARCSLACARSSPDSSRCAAASRRGSPS